MQLIRIQPLAPRSSTFYSGVDLYERGLCDMPTLTLDFNPFHMDPKMWVKSGLNLHSTQMYTFHTRESTLDMIWVEPSSQPWVESRLKMAERRADRGATWHNVEVKALLEIWSSEVIQAQLLGVCRNEAVYQSIIDALELCEIKCNVAQECLSTAAASITHLERSAAAVNSLSWSMRLKASATSRRRAILRLLACQT